MRLRQGNQFLRKKMKKARKKPRPLFQISDSWLIYIRCVNNTTAALDAIKKASFIFIFFSLT